MSDENLLSILLEDNPFPDEWSARQILELTSNPIYAGIGPLTGDYKDERISIPVIPAIVTDKQWIDVQVNNVEEFGVRNVLLLTRKVLHEALGVKLAVLAHHTWLDKSVEEMKTLGVEGYFRSLLEQLRSTDNATRFVTEEVKIKEVTPQIIEQIVKSPSELLHLPPDKFEDLIYERIQKMGFSVDKVGNGTYGKDGGIDIIAVPKDAPFPFLLAVQVKHHKTFNRKTGSRDVRDLLGVLNNSPFHAGLLVTNTTFTPDAQWLAKQREGLVRLRDFEDISKWLVDNFLHSNDWREFPRTIEICPGVHIDLSQFS